VLIGLILPAVQKVRAAADRVKCQNNAKQLGIALQQYHEVEKGFPRGCINYGNQLFNYPRTTWTIFLLPYLEQQIVFDLTDLNAAAGQGMAVWTNPINCMGTQPPTSQVLSVMLCPSDNGPVIHHHPSVLANFSRGNYAGFFGNLTMGQAANNATGHLPAAFQMNKFINNSQVTDGTSNTMMLGEVLRGISGNDYDYRGVFWYDHVASSQIFTTNGPNSSNADVLFPTWCPPSVNLPHLNLPCIAGTTDGSNHHASSRSRHSRGVNVLFADGSVHYIFDSVDVLIWQALGSINGNETASLP
jgi:prepilin-type processing-associated H-X9-DG protein